MTTRRKASEKDMANAKDKVSADKEVAANLAASFLSVLDNDEVIAKLARILSISFQLILDEKLDPLNKKLDKFAHDNKILVDRVSSAERENDKLKQLNAGLKNEVTDLQAKVNMIEQDSRRNSLIITGVPETFAERVTGGEIADGGQPHFSRNDTLQAVCTVVHEACKVQVVPADIQAAYRLKGRQNAAGTARPLLVSFHSTSTRDLVMKARRPRETLTFRGSKVYFNDHLTTAYADIFHKARSLVKEKAASSTWIANGRIFIKWADGDRPSRILSLSDLN